MCACSTVALSLKLLFVLILYALSHSIIKAYSEAKMTDMEAKFKKAGNVSCTYTRAIYR